MTMIEISLPDELARRAKSEGLLSDTAIQQLLEDAIRRRAGRTLLDVARNIHEARVPVMSMEEIDATIKTMRSERRLRTEIDSAGGPDDDAGSP